MKNVLNYFVRKAFGFKSTATAEDKTLFGHLLRIRQNIQGVYDWLYGRLSAEHLPKRMPMTEAVTSADGHEVHIAKAWNSDNLLAHLRLLDGRKISNGYQDGTPADDGLPDGVSLARLLCDSTTQPTALVDDNRGWELTKGFSNANIERMELHCRRMFLKGQTNDTIFSLPALKHLRLTCSTITANGTDNLPTYTPIFSSSPLESVDLPNLTAFFGRLFVGGSLPEELVFPNLIDAGSCIAQSCKGVKRIIADKVTTCIGYSYHPNLISGCQDLEYASFPNLSSYTVYGSGDGAGSLQDMPNLKHLVIGKVAFTSNSTPRTYALDGCPNLIRLEIMGELNQSLYLNFWSPTLNSSNLSLFLDNFLHFIAERVADRTGKSSLTLTLSAAVYAALEQQEGQTILALLNTKGWTVASA